MGGDGPTGLGFLGGMSAAAAFYLLIFAAIAAFRADSRALMLFGLAAGLPSLLW